MYRHTRVQARHACLASSALLAFGVALAPSISLAASDAYVYGWELPRGVYTLFNNAPARNAVQGSPIKGRVNVRNPYTWAGSTPGALSDTAAAAAAHFNAVNIVPTLAASPDDPGVPGDDGLPPGVTALSMPIFPNGSTVTSTIANFYNDDPSDDPDVSSMTIDVSAMGGVNIAGRFTNKLYVSQDGLVATNAGDAFLVDPLIGGATGGMRSFPSPYTGQAYGTSGWGTFSISALNLLAAKAPYYWTNLVSVKTAAYSLVGSFATSHVCSRRGMYYKIDTTGPTPVLIIQWNVVLASQCNRFQARFKGPDIEFVYDTANPAASPLAPVAGIIGGGRTCGEAGCNISTDFSPLWTGVPNCTVSTPLPNCKPTSGIWTNRGWGIATSAARPIHFSWAPGIVSSSEYRTGGSGDSLFKFADDVTEPRGDGLLTYPKYEFELSSSIPSLLALGPYTLRFSTEETCANDATCGGGYAAMGPRPCVDASDCDDGNACSIGVCDGGQCEFSPVTCDDGNGCTDDACNPFTGCYNPPRAGTCDDGLNCTENDLCYDGDCVGTPVVCVPTGLDCVVNQCLEATGECVLQEAPVDAPCEDGDLCSVADSCDGAGGCVPGAPLACAGETDCTFASFCEPLTGDCSAPAAKTGESCDDGEVCTATSECAPTGTCVGTSLVSCDDFNGCTDEACVPGVGCVGTDNTAPCDDGDACTSNDTCALGFCDDTTPTSCTAPDACSTPTCDSLTGCGLAPVVCTPANACFVASCNPATGCVQEPLSCDDGDPTTADSCDPGASTPCQHVSCDDGNACTDDLGIGGVCQNTNNTASCSDGNACTTGDVCTDGACVGAYACDDGDLCTTDSCDTVLGCANEPVSCGASDACATNYCDAGNGQCVTALTDCDDGDPLTIDTCDPGVVGGCQHENCNDGIDCTIDSVNAGQCEHLLDNAQCDDGNACTTNVCTPTGCAFEAVNCDDGDPCTIDQCAANGACEHSPACDDGNPLTVDSCNPTTGACSNLNCNDGNPCTDDLVVSGACVNTPNVASCDDGNACTTGDTCVLGACVGTALDCNDNLACTVDSCVAGTCQNVVSCDDGNPATNDYCDASGACQHATGANAPVAQCRNVTVPTAPGACTAVSASVDDGSYDVDPGDTLTFSPSPAGPFGLGSHSVTLTVTDNAGHTASCVGTVTVVDSEGPAISCNAVAGVKQQRDTFTATALDSCSSPVVTQITGYSCPGCTAWLDNGGTRINIDYPGNVGDTVTWTVKATDAAGNQSTRTCSTTVIECPIGLVAAYSFNEGSGNVARDSSGYLVHGAVNNATWTASGKNGGALEFNGVNASVGITDNSLLHLYDGMTLSAWVYPVASTGWTTIILKEGPDSLRYALYGADGTGAPPAAYVHTGADQARRAGAALTLNTWTHLAATYSAADGKLKVYVNGGAPFVKTVSGARAIHTSTNALRIGGNTVWGEFFKGKIDDVRVYDRALTQTEILSDMITPVPTFAP